jgi:hypothetical protein
MNHPSKDSSTTRAPVPGPETYLAAANRNTFLTKHSRARYHFDTALYLNLGWQIPTPFHYALPMPPSTASHETSSHAGPNLFRNNQ